MDESTQDIQLDLFCKKDNHSDLQEKVKELEKECDRLRVENYKLKQQLSLRSARSHPVAQTPSDPSYRKENQAIHVIIQR